MLGSGSFCFVSLSRHPALMAAYGSDGEGNVVKEPAHQLRSRMAAAPGVGGRGALCPQIPAKARMQRTNDVLSSVGSVCHRAAACTTENPSYGLSRVASLLVALDVAFGEVVHGACVRRIWWQITEGGVRGRRQSRQEQARSERHGCIISTMSCRSEACVRALPLILTLSRGATRTCEKAEPVL